MEKITLRRSISANMLIELTEEEAGALDALAGYGVDSFLAVFYNHMGRAYMQPYEAGLRSLFGYIRGASGISSTLDRANNARRVFSGEHVAISKEAYKHFEELAEAARAAKSHKNGPEE